MERVVRRHEVGEVVPVGLLREHPLSLPVELGILGGSLLGGLVVDAFEEALGQHAGNFRRLDRRVRNGVASHDATGIFLGPLGDAEGFVLRQVRTLHIGEKFLK